MSLFGDAIYTYTRKQAIDDGILTPVDGSPYGFHLPTVIAAGLYGECESWAAHENCDVETIISQVLALAHEKIVETALESDRLNIDLPWRPGSYFIAHIGPGDRGEPVLTFMMPEDD